MLERLQLLEAANIGVGGGQVGDGLLICVGLRVIFLLRNGVRLAQILPTISGDLRNIQLRGGLLTTGASLGQFLIDFRSIDVREQCALGNVAANVPVPAPQVSTGASVDWGLFVGLQGGGQHEFFVWFFRNGVNDRDRGNGIDFRFLGQGAPGTKAAEHARSTAQQQHDYHQHDNDHRPAR